MFALLLLPLELLFKLILYIRNKLYDLGVFKSTGFPIPVVSIGNLKVGGTGKTPHTEYLVRLLRSQTQQNLAILSRGYGRKTQGYILASEKDSADTIGDEPYQYYWKWKDVLRIAVCEKRVEGVRQLLKLKQAPTLVLLDDAYQHRAIDPGMNILLTEYDKPFYKDRLLPSGRLRESRSGADRANIIIVTKCPADLNERDADLVRSQIQAYNNKANIYFTYIVYGSLVPITRMEEARDLDKPIVLVTGIADGSILYNNLLAMSYNIVKHKSFKDHKDYTEADIYAIMELCKQHNSVLITTEKDAVKLKGRLPEDFPAYYIPIEIDFLWGKDQFNNELILFSAQK